MSEMEREAAVTAWLERKPEVVVPEDFAARVMCRVPAMPVARAPRAVGRRVAVVSVVVLSVMLFALARYATPSFQNFSFDMELMVVVELGALGYWLAKPKSVWR